MTDQARVNVQIQDSIAHVALNRPDVHNGLDWEMFQELIATAKSLRKNPAVRAVILSGNGPSFCAGLDLKSVQKQPSVMAKLMLKWPWQTANIAQRIALVWQELPIPVIAAVHGNCFGGGLQIAACCDFRFSTPDAKWSVMEARWGLVPDMSGTLALRQLVRHDVALELSMTGRVIDAQEAHALGLVSHLSDEPLQSAQKLAEELIQQSPDALAGTKLLFRKNWTSSRWMALCWERWTQFRLLSGKNQRIAVRNGNNKDSNFPFKNRSRWW